MKIVLFGSGNVGKRAFARIGKDNIFAVVDNYATGSFFEMSQRIISLDEAIGFLDEDTVFIISTTLQYAFEIAAQLRSKGIYNYIIWEEIADKSRETILRRCNEITIKQENEVTRLESELIICRGIIERLNKQRDYFLSHIEASSILPASGPLRQRQLELVRYSEEIFSMLDDDIHPILSAGNLLGLIRHGGFIPWDDDMDFKLIRKEYNRLVEICRNRYYCARYYGNSVYSGGEKELEDWIDCEIKNHPNLTICIETPYHFQLWKGRSYNDSVYIDFFVIDAYEDDYSFDEHKTTLLQVRNEMLNAVTCKEAYEVIEKYQIIDRKKWSDSKANNYFYGIDNMESYDYYRWNDNWITKDMIFPLKKALFEGHEFYIPNNPGACLTYVFGENYMKLPTNIALSNHVKIG